ncbi:ankyrin repeat domain-containing protein [Candidatus Avelusimicrobium alvi]|uniref:ankyrin repeat domain-containing protein n=1 Tax=Candidatus Avelusimicrobium alvi TaxID=3416221 RepID=UPI003D0B5A21
MKTKIAIVFVALAAVWLGLSYHIRLQNEKGESLVADAYYGDLLAVKNGLEQGAPLRYVLYFQDEERDYGGAEFNALHAAASGGNEDVINFLLDQGLDINSPTPQGWTPLFIAARDGRAEAAKLLVYRQADLNAQTDRGATALMMAVTQKFPSEKEREDLLVYMLKRGADVNLQDASGNPPLYYAAVQKNPKIVELLLEYGAAPDQATKEKILKLVSPRSDKGSKKIAALLKKKAAK